MSRSRAILLPCRAGLLVAGLCAAALLPACGPETRPPRLAGSGMDMFAPVALRVHPLSRLVASPPRVEAHVEFADQMGDIGKGVGTLTFTLHAYSLTAAGHRGDALATWHESIATPDSNQQHFDSITRTYVFMLTLPHPLSPDTRRVVLHAVLNKPNGGALADDLIMNVAEP